jgi:AcrR family transcriptional regulator
MHESGTSLSREKVFDVAEALFSRRGYASVTLRDIANQLEMKQASLYYHVPKGKEELYVEVIERGLRRHQDGLRGAIQNAGEQWQAQLRAAAHWLLSQPPMNLSRMVQSDMPEISPENAARLMTGVYEAILSPLEQIFAQAQAEAAIALPYSGILVGAFLSLVDGIHQAPVPGVPFDKHDTADQIIDVLIRGLEKP